MQLKNLGRFLQIIPDKSALPAKTIDQLKKYLANEYADNTRKSYASDLKHFAAFCEQNGLLAFPATPETLLQYLTVLADSMKVSTLVRRLSAIKKIHEEKGMDSPTDHPNIKRLMRGIKRTKGVKPKQSKAIRKATLNKIVESIPKETAKGLRDRTLLLWGFMGAFRRSELVALRFEDLSFDENGITVFIPRSKSDQEGQGQYKAIPYNSRVAICPIRTFQKYQEAIGVEEGFVFLSFWKGDKPRFGKPIPKRNLNRIFDLYLKEDGYTPHSLRAGFVTEAKRARSTDNKIIAQTGQKIATIQTYVRPINVWEDNAVHDIPN